MDGTVAERWKMLEDKIESLIASREEIRKSKDSLAGQIQELSTERDGLQTRISELESKSAEMEERLNRGQEVLGRALARLESALTDNMESKD